MTDQVVTQLSQWLGVGSDDRLTALRWSFGVPGFDERRGWLIVACVLILAGSVWFYLRLQPRRRRGLAMSLALCRAALLMTAVLILADPILLAEMEETVPASLWLLLDGRETMSSHGSSPDGAASKTRLERVRDALLRGDPNFLERLRARLRVEVFMIDAHGNLRPIDVSAATADGELPPDAPHSASSPSRSLGAALDEVVSRSAGGVPDGILLFSDFNSDDGRQATEAAQRLRVPLFTVGVEPLVATEERRESHATNENEMNSVRRVLVADYEPTWEWRYLKDTLLRDPRVGPRGFRTFLRSADRQVREQDPLFLPELPRDRDDLLSYDVIVLGDLPAATLGTRFCELTKEFVEGGGGLIIWSGPRFGPAQLAGTPLDELLPVTFEADSLPSEFAAFHPRLTSAGENAEFMNLIPDSEANLLAWHKLKLHWYQPALAVRPQTTVLLEHPTAMCSDRRTPQPLIALRRMGRGEVLYLAFNEMWRLRGRSGPHAYREFWTRTIHRLAARRSGADTMELADDADQSLETAPRNLVLQHELARLTGGKTYELQEIDQALEDFRPPEHWQTTSQVIPIWNHWWAFVWVVGLMHVEWWARKRIHLP